MDDTRRLKIAFFFIGLSVLFVRSVTSPAQFPDFDTYLYVSDAISFQPIRDTLSYEPFSSLLIIGLRQLAGNSFAGLELAHWLISFLFVFGFYRICVLGQFDWKAAILVLGAYGSLLAFVTVRATPAYLLIWLAAVLASRGRPIALLPALLAFGFHSSAALAVPPIVLSLLQQRSRHIGAFFSNNVLMAVSVTFIAILFVAFYTVMIDYLFILFNFFGSFIGKYMVYLTAFEGNEGTQQATSDSALFHTIYLVMASGLTIASLVSRDDKSVRMRGYVILSYAVFIFLSASPVSAYRQSIFWTVPALLAFPWQRFALKGFGSFGIAAVGGIAFVVGLRSIVL